jgi:hypothetical protein
MLCMVSFYIGYYNNDNFKLLIYQLLCMDHSFYLAEKIVTK